MARCRAPGGGDANVARALPTPAASTARSIPSQLPQPRARPASQPDDAGRAASCRSSGVRSGSRRRLQRRPPRPPASSCGRQFLRSGRASASPGGAESVPRRITQGRELSWSSESTNDAQSFGQSRTLRVKQLLGLTCSMANPDLAAPRATFCPAADFHGLSRAEGPAATSCGNRPRHPANPSRRSVLAFRLVFRRAASRWRTPRARTNPTSSRSPPILHGVQSWRFDWSSVAPHRAGARRERGRIPLLTLSGNSPRRSVLAVRAVFRRPASR